MNPVKNIFSALLLFLLLPVMDVSGQIEAGKRLEFELREGYENFDLAQFRHDKTPICHFPEIELNQSFHNLHAIQIQDVFLLLFVRKHPLPAVIKRVEVQKRYFLQDSW